MTDMEHGGETFQETQQLSVAIAAAQVNGSEPGSAEPASKAL